MSDQSARQGRARVFALVAIAAAVSLAAQARAFSAAELLLAFLGLSALLLCINFAKTQTLLSIAIALNALIPARILGSVPIMGDLGAGFFFFAAWLAVVATRRNGFRASLPAAALLAWIALLLVVAESSSLNWATAFAVYVLLPATVNATRDEITSAESTLVRIGIAVASLALVQQLTASNPLLDPAYQALNLPPLQHWSVYRSEGTLSHPLYAGTFLSLAAVIQFKNVLRTERAGLRGWIVFSLLVLGVGATVSRGSIVAVVLGCFLVWILSFRSSGQQAQTGRLVIVGSTIAVGTVAFLNSSLLEARSASAEGTSSLGSRLFALDYAWSLAWQSFPLGIGPGASSIRSLRDIGLPIENAWLQALASLGIIGLILLVLFVGSAFRRAASTNSLVGTVPLMTYVVSVAGYNAFDDVKPGLMYLGVALFIASGPRAVDDQTDDDSDREPRVKGRMREVARRVVPAKQRQV